MINYKKELKQEVDYIFDYICLKDCLEFAKQLFNYKNNSIYFLGIGKSNNVAKHFSDILKSLGYKSFNLNYTNILHGDLGVIQKQDLLILISNSGNTKEILNSIELIKKKECYIYGIFGNCKAKLIDYCEKVVILRNCIELDLFNMIPSTSIINFIIFFTLTIRYLLDINKIDIKEYGINHPAGNIGRTIWTTVKSKLISFENIPYFYIEKLNSINVFDIMLLMDTKKMGICCFVDNNQKLVGIITNGSLIRYISKQHSLDKVDILSLLNYSPITIVDKTNYRIDDLDLKIVHRYFPVIENNKLIGIYQNIL